MPRKGMYRSRDWAVKVLPGHNNAAETLQIKEH
jgi:hypothetical protein